MRRGERNPQNLYEQTGPEPDHAENSRDVSIGWGRAEVVAIVVRAVNEGVAIPGAQEWWFAGDEHGALIYDRSTARFASGWVLVVRSRAVADRIVAAVNGARRGRAGTLDSGHSAFLRRPQRGVRAPVSCSPAVAGAHRGVVQVPGPLRVPERGVLGVLPGVQAECGREVVTGVRLVHDLTAGREGTDGDVLGVDEAWLPPGIRCWRWSGSHMGGNRTAAPLDIALHMQHSG